MPMKNSLQGINLPWKSKNLFLRHRHNSYSFSPEIPWYENRVTPTGVTFQYLTILLSGPPPHGGNDKITILFLAHKELL